MIFGIFPLMFVGVAVLILASRTGNLPFNNSPRLIVEAVVVSKRQNYETNSYYLTFQFESSDRLELRVNGNIYGMLVPGDYGKLTFQGRRYIDFQRENFIPDKTMFR